MTRPFALTLRTIGLCLLLPAASVFGQTPHAPDTDRAREPLPTWEQLSQAQRDALIAPTRERWNANPDKRARIMKHARQWASLPADERNRVHRGMYRWERMDPTKRAQMKRLFSLTRSMPPEQRHATFTLFHAMRKQSPEQRNALRQQWLQMTPDQRATWLHDNTPRRKLDKTDNPGLDDLHH